MYVRAQVAVYVQAICFEDFQELTQGRYLDLETRGLWAQQWVDLDFARFFQK
jgi:hypothetical protein